MYALDANVVVHFLERKGRGVERFSATQPGELLVPAVVLYELEVGTRRAAHAQKRRAALAQLLNGIQEIPFDGHVARIAADVRHQLETAGQMIGAFDILIAASALSRGARLVTHKAAEFQRVPGLSVVDWY